jgi:hypothetical protein
VIPEPPTQPANSSVVAMDLGIANPQFNSTNSLEIDTLLGRPQLHQFNFSELNPSWAIGLSFLVIKEGEGTWWGGRQPPGASLNF